MLRLFVLRLILFAILSLHLHFADAAASGPTPNSILSSSNLVQDWRPELGSHPGRVGLMAAMVNRHPFFLQSIASHYGKPAEILEVVSQYLSTRSSEDPLQKEHQSKVGASRITHLKHLREDQQGRIFSFEQVPPLIGLFRGAVGFDCSMTSVVLYALHPNARVAWIRKGESTDKDPIGYMFWIEVPKSSEDPTPQPLLLTINGLLVRQTETQAAIAYLQALYPNQEVLFARQRELINSDLIRIELSKASMLDTLEIEAPQNWSAISDWQKKVAEKHNQSENTTDFYAFRYWKDSINRLRTPEKPRFEMLSDRFTQKYFRPRTQELIGMPISKRALLAHYFPYAFEFLRLDPRLLSIPPQIVRSEARQVLTESPSQAIEDLNKWAEQLDLDLPGLLSLFPSQARLAYLIHLEQQDPEVSRKHGFDRMKERMFSDLERRVQHSFTFRDNPFQFHQDLYLYTYQRPQRWAEILEVVKSIPVELLNLNRFFLGSIEATLKKYDSWSEHQMELLLHLLLYPSRRGEYQNGSWGSPFLRDKFLQAGRQPINTNTLNVLREWLTKRAINSASKDLVLMHQSLAALHFLRIREQIPNEFFEMITQLLRSPGIKEEELLLLLEIIKKDFTMIRHSVDRLLELFLDSRAFVRNRAVLAVNLLAQNSESLEELDKVRTFLTQNETKLIGPIFQGLAHVLQKADSSRNSVGNCKTIHSETTMTGLDSGFPGPVPPLVF